ncbi:MAG: hypothetical protein R3A47_06650 [Polyangiales bacterium]
MVSVCSEFFLIVSLLSGAWSLVSPATASANSIRDEWSGEYIFVETKKQLERINRAILRATDELDGVLKRIATQRLSSAARPYEKLKFEVLGDRIRTWLSGHGPWENGVDGHWINAVSADGTHVRVMFREIAGDLVQTIKTRQGSRTNRFKLEDGGKTVRMHVKIESKKLPTPVMYSITYKRADVVATLCTNSLTIDG